MKTVYKILFSHNRKLYSMIKIHTIKEKNKGGKYKFVQRYFTNRTNYPKYGKIFAFDNLEAAQRYLYCFNDVLADKLVIVEATTTKTSTPKQLGIEYIPYYTAEDKVITFWSDEYYSVSPRNRNNIPDNTVFCDDLTLLRKILI